MATMVTGGTGFVGSNVVRTLAQHGHEVICFDLVAPDILVRRYLQPWADQVTFVQGDILSLDDLERVARHSTVTKIVHAAVFTPSHTSNIEMERSRSIVDINLVGTANLLDLACRMPLERFLYVSSEAVYGEGHCPSDTLQEDAALRPRNLYAVTKYASELLARRYGEIHGFQTVSVRLSYPYGPMERVTQHRTRMSQLYQWTGNVVRGEPVRVNDRSVGRDYTYVLDAAAGIRTIMDAPSLPHDVYNISVGHSITLGEVITALQELSPTVQVIDDPPIGSGTLGPGVARSVRDATRLREDLGFTTSFDLLAGIRDYLQWREAYSSRD